MRKQITAMGMPATVMIVDENAKEQDIDEVFSYLTHIDKTFSTYKKTSEISQINEGLLKIKNASEEVQYVLELCKQTTKETNGYFAIERQGKIDPSGIVKGYAIHEGANILRQKGYKNFFVEVAGDVEVHGKNEDGEDWKIGIESPFNRKEMIKVVTLTNHGIATSGNYLQGNHIYNPITGKEADAIMSISIIGPNVYEADRFATAAFAMGEKGINFIERLSGFEGYMVKKDKTAIFTSGFNKFVLQ